MNVRAKFRVQSVTRTLSSKWENGKSVPVEVQTIKLFPVTGGSEENARFFESTPTGEINLATVNAEAAKAFELNKEYYVDFTPADTEAK